MSDDSGCRSIQADETKRAHDPRCAPALRQKRLVSQSVLQGQQRGFVSHQGREQCLERFVGGCFQGDNYEITRSDLVGVARGIDVGYVHDSSLRLNPQPVLADDFQVRSQQEMNVKTRVRQHAAVVASDRTRADDGNFSEGRFHAQISPKSGIRCNSQSSPKTNALRPLFRGQRQNRLSRCRQTCNLPFPA